LIALSFLGLFGLILQPTLQSKENRLTAYLHTNIDTKNAKFVETNNTKHFQFNDQLNPNFITVIKAEQIKEQYPTVDSIIVLGNSISKSQLQNWPALPTRFINQTSKSNSTEVSLQQAKTNLLGATNTIKISIKDSLQQFNRYVLEHPFLPIDSNQLNESSFEKEIAFNAIAAGNYTTHLSLMDDSTNQKATYVTPFQVLDRAPLNIFMLNAYPNFESKYLGEWLGKQGHQMLISTKISKNKFNYKRINITGEGPIQFNKNTLNDIELLIIDGTSLANLTEYENKLLQELMKKGLHIFIKYDAGIKTANSFWQNKLNISTDVKVSQAAYTLNNKSNDMSIDLNFYPNKSNLKSSQLFGSIYNAQILSHNRSSWSRIGISFIEKSHTAILKGNKVAYHWLWSSIINEMLPTKVSTENDWILTDAYPTEGEEFEVALISKEESPKAFIENSNGEQKAIILTQDYIIDSRFNAKINSPESGWHYLFTEKNKDKKAIYIYGIADNQLQKQQAEKATINALQQSIEKQTFTNDQQADVYTKKPISPIWFWLISIFALSLLWWLEK